MSEVQEIKVKCASCSKEYPVHVVASKGEREKAEEAAKQEGGGVIEVARYCPFCGETTMVEIPVSAAEPESSDQEVVLVFAVTGPLTGRLRASDDESLGEKPGD